MIYEFTPTQDLHGYDKPWPAGGGKNICPPIADGWVDGYVASNGSVYPDATNGEKTSPFIKVQEELAYSFSYNLSGTPSSNYWSAIGWYDENNTFLRRDAGNTGSNYTVRTATAPSGAAYARVSFRTYNMANWVQFAQSSSFTSYSPYSNICPLEGYNIWDPNNQEYVQVYSGYVNSNTRELYLRPVYQEYAGEELVGPWMSSLDPYEEDTTPTEGAFVIDFGGEMTSYEITPFMLQTLLESLGIRQHFTNGARLLNSLMDQAQGRVRSEVELLHLSRPLNVIAIGDQLPAGITFKPIFKDVLPGLPGKFIR